MLSAHQTALQTVQDVRPPALYCVENYIGLLLSLIYKKHKTTIKLFFYVKHMKTLTYQASDSLF